MSCTFERPGAEARVLPAENFRPAGRIAAARMAIINADRIKAESLQYFCSIHWGFEVVAVEHSASDGIVAVAHTRPDLTLVALALPDLEPGATLRELHAASPGTKIVIQLTQCSEYLLHRIGAAKYQALLHDAEETLAALGEAINRARHGLRTISSRIAQCQTALQTAPGSFPKILSNREQGVLVCIAHSMSDEETARQLGLTRHTAQTHRRNILRKLGVGGTPKLIRWCIDKGFNAVPPPVPAATPQRS